jgi:hypothetical protein
MITFKLNSIGDCANKIVDGVPTGEWHHIEYSEEYLAWVAEGNEPEPPDEPESP